VNVILAVPIRTVSARTENPFQTASQTGLGDLLVGARFKILGGATAVALEADWEIPPGYERDVFPGLGEGFHHLSGQLDLGVSIRPIQGFAQGSVGYRASYDVRMNPSKATRHVGADVLYYDADLGVWIGNHLLLAGSFAGFSSKAEGPLLETSGTSAGPEVRYRVDDRVDVFTGARFDLTGRSVLRTNAYYLGLALKQTGLDRLQGFLGSARRP
jgi:hypothetical protein